MKIAINIPESKYQEFKNYNGFMSYAEYLIKNGTPIEEEPKTGHWIGHREHCENLGVMPNGLGAYEWCSNCECGIDIREWQRNPHNYCPNCGARMNEVSK